MVPAVNEGHSEAAITTTAAEPGREGGGGVAQSPQPGADLVGQLSGHTRGNGHAGGGASAGQAAYVRHELQERAVDGGDPGMAVPELRTSSRLQHQRCFEIVVA